MGLIVDASVVVAWLLPNQANEMTRRALAEHVVSRASAPHGLPVEVVHALHRQERRLLLAASEVDASVRTLKELDIGLDATPAIDNLEEWIRLSRRHALKVADAAYIDLALRSGHPLATRDAAMAEAARFEGVRLFA